MSLLLNIDTAVEKAQVSFAKDGVPMCSLSSNDQKEHASFLQSAIRQLAGEAGIDMKDIDAVAVTAGPGSYTGLRVGMSSAKGLCYALNKPLIALNTLEVLAFTAVQAMKEDGEWLYCPMIDARRMEVFTAVYNKALKLIVPPCAMILDERSFSEQLLNNKVLFFGNGSKKWMAACKHSNASFADISITPYSMSLLAEMLFAQQRFSDLAYSEPVYLKGFNDSPAR